MDDDQIFAACGQLRRELADWCGTLTPEQLATRSLCDEWTVREVSGHLTAVLTTSNLSLLLTAARYGGNIHRANAELARREADRPLAEQLQRLRERADKRFAPPVVGVRGPLTDLMVHDGDMRLPLGLEMHPQPELAIVVLDFLSSGAPGFVPKSRLKGLTLVATDADRRWGNGLEIHGTMADLMMAVCGRSATLDRLGGPGVAELTRRI